MWKTGIEVRKDMTAAILRKKARTEKEGYVAARMLAIANVLDGMDREPATASTVLANKGQAVQGPSPRAMAKPPAASSRLFILPLLLSGLTDHTP